MLKNILKSISVEDIRSKQEYMASVSHHFLYNSKVREGDVYDLILRRLQFMKANYKPAAGVTWT